MKEASWKNKLKSIMDVPVIYEDLFIIVIVISKNYFCTTNSAIEILSLQYALPLEGFERP
jgi:hypothetical protein